MKVGYSRVSTHDQDLAMQHDALKSAKCDEIYSDIASGVKAQRPGLEQALSYLRAGDTLVVWKLDRLGRSIQHLIQTIQTLNNKDIGFQSLQENINTTTSSGKLVFHIFSALAEFEKDLITERTRAGLQAARSRGRLGGRPAALNLRQIERLLELYNERKSTISEICKIFNISKSSFYNYISKQKKAIVG